jgi:hypothetical protein
MLGVEVGTNVRVGKTVREAESIAGITVVRAADRPPASTIAVYTDVASTAGDCEYTAVTSVLTREGKAAPADVVGCSCPGAGVTVKVAIMWREAESNAVTVVIPSEGLSVP